MSSNAYGTVAVPDADPKTHGSDEHTAGGFPPAVPSEDARPANASARGALGAPEDDNLYPYLHTSSKIQEPSMAHHFSESLKGISYAQFDDKSFSLSNIPSLPDEAFNKNTLSVIWS